MVLSGVVPTRGVREAMSGHWQKRPDRRLLIHVSNLSG